MNKLVLKPKAALSAAESALVANHLSAPEHIDDKGPPTCWNSYQNGLYACFEETSGALVGLVEASGRPITSPGWWIDSAFRGKHYGKPLIDVLARFLKADGVTCIAPISIQTRGGLYDAQSTALAKHLRSYFP